MSKTKITAQELPTVAGPAISEDQHALRILLVEDSEDNRLLIQSYLRKTPYQIDIAENGEIAVEKLKYGSYDLVLMDMQMPVMDGYTAAKVIRNWESEKGVKPTPIIALTAYALKGDAQKSLDAGCTAHITKPIKKVTLIETIREYT
jgi:two-component system, sensor histidine kinase and response regulator